MGLIHDVQACEVPEKQYFEWNGELYCVVSFTVDKNGGIIDMFVLDIRDNLTKFNPYCIVSTHVATCYDERGKRIRCQGTPVVTA